MDRMVEGNGRFDGNFGARDGSGNQPASTSGRHGAGLSKPRMVKVRKGTSRIKPSVLADDDGGLEFNPFRSGLNSGGETGGLDLKLDRSSSFDGVDGNRVSENVNSCCSEVGEGSSGFAFASNSAENPGGVFRSFAEISSGDRNVENTVSGNKPGAFMFEVGVGTSLSSSSDPKLGSSESKKSEEPVFVFSTAVSGSDATNIGSGRLSNDAKFSWSSVGNISDQGLSSFRPSIPEGAGFVFGASSMGRSNLSPEEVRNTSTGNLIFGSNGSSSVASDRGPSLINPDGIQNLNARPTSNIEVTSGKLNNSELGGKGAADFVHNYGDNKNGPSSLSSAAAVGDSQPQGVINLDKISETKSKCIKNQNVEDTASTFVFRSNSSNICKPLSVSSSNLDDTSKSFLDDELRFKDAATPLLEPDVLGYSSPFVTNFTFAYKNKGRDTPTSGLNVPGVCVFSDVNSHLEPHKGAPSGLRKSGAKNTKKKKGKDKVKLPTLSHIFPQPCASMVKGKETLELDSPSSYYSAMDYSPKEENLVSYQSSRDASVASDDSDFFQEASIDVKTFDSEYETENLVSTTQQLKIGEDSARDGNIDTCATEYLGEMDFSAAYCQPNDSETYQVSSILDGISESSDCNTAETETGANASKQKLDKQIGGGETIFAFNSKLDESSKVNFPFNTSFSQGSASKQLQRGKSRIRGGQFADVPPPSYVPVSSPSPISFPVSSLPMQLDHAQDGMGKGSDSKQSEKGSKLGIMKDNVRTDVSIVPAHEICERWRLRGNEAYSKGYLTEAEEYYSCGMNSIPQNETSASCNKALLLCYSNRAAARMSLGRISDALSDCMMAIAIDPKFLRAKLRAANCYLALGEVDDALKHFEKCLQSENEGNLDQKILMEASDGLRKTQQLARCITLSKELLQKRTYGDVEKALQIISEALIISPHSEYLLQGKANALFRLRKYYEVIEFCQKISPTNKMDGSQELESFTAKNWCWHLMSKSYFYLGKLEEALELLKKLEHEKVNRNKDTSSESSSELFITITKLLHLKTAGNNAFQEGKHVEAVEHYTAALACNIESPRFAAICFCNRAAAFQALGQIVDAIADCSLAIALDGTYSKALSRRATLYEMIRDYGQAANDLRRLISLLENQNTNKDDPSGILGRPVNTVNELNRVRARLCAVEDEARNDVPLDVYMILGIKPSCSAADAKKAYRKSALRHHPDKAGQFLTRSENIDEELWREALDEVHKDADRLFKIIGEAYSIVSDSAKRLCYDTDEELRANRKKAFSTNSTSKTVAENYSNQFEKGINLHHWRTYESTYRRYSESSRSNM